jgi:hypothetical protein
MAANKSVAGQLVTAGLVVLVLAFLLAILMPALNRVRSLSISKSMSYEGGSYSGGGPHVSGAASAEQAAAKPKAGEAIVESFDAEIALTPKLSVGTALPEPIYMAEFKATISARALAKEQGECQIELPLPPQVISLANVDIKVDGVSSENFDLVWNRLAWRGLLDSEKPSQITVNYSATGKGVYALQKPSGKVIDLFRTKLVADRSNIRMLELSLQPNSVNFANNKTTYAWEYKRLVVARPIAVDVLGIAAIDRLGELTWLGPLSVVVFGILIALVGLAYDPEKLTGWVLVLVVGCFAGAYPLMYFMQDFVSLGTAIGIAVVIIVGVVGWRIVSLCGLKHGIFGGVILPIVILLFTLATAIVSNSSMQGVLLTAMTIFTLVVAMILLPIAQAKFKARREVDSRAKPEGN